MRIIFFCGRGLEPWAPPSLDSGIGGSETAVIHIAALFAKHGAHVDVYNDADRFEGEYEHGVGYWDCKRLRVDEPCDVLVGWRGPAAHVLPVKARLRVLWLHDLNYGPDSGPNIAKWDRVLGVSAWHAGMLRGYYEGTVDQAKIDFVPNGVDLERFRIEIKRQYFQCVYASSPDRGLERLLKIWPSIIEHCPGGRLKVAYGWDNVDRLIAQGRNELADMKATITGLAEKLPSVEMLGRLGQGALAQLYAESALATYPSHFLETSCISMSEAMAGGCVPVTSQWGALPEAVGPGGLIVPGMPYSQEWMLLYGLSVRGLLTNYSQRVDYQREGWEHVKGHTWESAYAKWQRIIDDALTAPKRTPSVKPKRGIARRRHRGRSLARAVAS